MNYSQNTHFLTLTTSLKPAQSGYSQIFSGAREPQPCGPQVEKCEITRSGLPSHSAHQSWGPGWDRPGLSLPSLQLVPCLGHQVAPRSHGSPGLRRLGGRLSHPATCLDRSPACGRGTWGCALSPGQVKISAWNSPSAGRGGAVPSFLGHVGYPSSEDVLCAEQVSSSAEPTKALTRGLRKADAWVYH